MMKQPTRVNFVDIFSFSENAKQFFIGFSEEHSPIIRESSLPHVFPPEILDN